MAALFQILFRICTFKCGPEVLPAYNALLGLLIVINAVVSFGAAVTMQAFITLPEEVTSQLSDEQIAAMSDYFLLFTRVVVTLASVAALTWGLLALTGNSARVTKTLTAIFGTDIILTVIAALSLVVASNMHELVRDLVNLGMVFWNIAVLGFIYHRALEISVGLGIAAGLFVLIFTLAIGAVATTG